MGCHPPPLHLIDRSEGNTPRGCCGLRLIVRQFSGSLFRHASIVDSTALQDRTTSRKLDWPATSWAACRNSCRRWECAPVAHPAGGALAVRGHFWHRHQ